MGATTLVVGGARSGKSSYALAEGGGQEGRKAFIATAEALDDEMRERIGRHRKDRSDRWDTFEEPLQISRLLSQLKGRYGVIVIDCLTLWVSNLIHADIDPSSRFDSLVPILAEESDSHIYLISNEVGMGIVPEHPMARRYRDLLGSLNKRIAEIADSVILMVAGIPLVIKGGRA